MLAENLHLNNEQGELACSYRLLRRLGSGATGEVWEAVINNQTVAIKILHNHLKGCSSLKKEFKLLSELSHANIVSIRGIQMQKGGTTFIEMEKIDGPSLAALAAERGGTLSWSELKPLALQLCRALAHAHAKGVVHRDVKPSNLLIDADGTLKLVDFGCAALTLHSQIEMTRTMEMISSGTLAFMSPQQINGSDAKPADDLYAVGATLHALLVGVPPFSAGHVVHQVLVVKPFSVSEHQKLRKVVNPVPRAVVRAIQACLEKDAKRRPASAVVLEAQLESECNGKTDRRKALVTLAGAGFSIAICGALPFIAKRTQPAIVEEGFQPIFNGQSLQGWQGNASVWTVQDGSICGRLQARRMADASNWRKEFLNWTGPVPDDFELRLQVRLKLPEIDAGNLGVRYRIDSRTPSISYDLDFEPIWKYNCGLREIGGRDMLARPTQMVRYLNNSEKNGAELLGHVANEENLKQAYRDNTWNDLTIRAVKNRLVHELNGITIVDCMDEDPDSRRLHGGIGLKIMLYYGPWVEARFRHIRLRAW